LAQKGHYGSYNGDGIHAGVPCVTYLYLSLSPCSKPFSYLWHASQCPRCRHQHDTLGLTTGPTEALWLMSLWCAITLIFLNFDAVLARQLYSTPGAPFDPSSASDVHGCIRAAHMAASGYAPIVPATHSMRMRVSLLTCMQRQHGMRTSSACADPTACRTYMRAVLRVPADMCVFWSGGIRH
jgi:hypothetical protein